MGQFYRTNMEKHGPPSMTSRTIMAPAAANGTCSKLKRAHFRLGDLGFGQLQLSIIDHSIYI